MYILMPADIQMIGFSEAGTKYLERRTRLFFGMLSELDLIDIQYLLIGKLVEITI